MSDMLDVRALMRLLLLARVELTAQESALNAMNVFPIPDGDTGTNMRATLDAGLHASAHVKAHDETSLDHVVRAIARSAQGNSGVILAEYIQGFLSHARRMPNGGFGFDADALARGLNEAARRTRRAVAEPVEGTVITVADAAAAGAVRARRSHSGVLGGGPDRGYADSEHDVCYGGNFQDVQGVAEQIHKGSAGKGSAVSDRNTALARIALGSLEAASRALEHSPQQLAALRSAGVVDAGGAGLVILLDSLARVCVGGSLPATSGRSLVRRLAQSPLRSAEACQVRIDGPGYEVMVAVEGITPAQADALREGLRELGESVVVAGSEGLYRLHIHTDAVVTTLSAMRDYAVLGNISVVRFAGPVNFGVTIRTLDAGICAYAKALGADVEVGAPAVLMNNECVSQTGVELLEFLDEMEFSAHTHSAADTEMPIEILPPETTWLVASYENTTSVHEALESLLENAMRDESAMMVLIHPELSDEVKQTLHLIAKGYSEAVVLNVNSGHAAQIGVSHA